MNFFFFSSRRRHTRFSRDWSSDVCSSDLIVESALDIVQRDGLRDHCGEVELTVERPLREPRKLEAGPWSPPWETRIRVRLSKKGFSSSSARAPGCGRPM